MLFEDLKKYVNQDVVVDTDTSVIYIGHLKEVRPFVLIFGEVDVHDMGDGQTNTTKEVYILECRKIGIRANRRGVHVLVSRVLSISLLDDIITY